MEEGRDRRERSCKNGGEEKTVGMDICTSDCWDFVLASTCVMTACDF
jgi:hypothetical protein